MANEILQWAAILGLLFFLAGAYRLAAMRPRSGVMTMDQGMGPHLGTILPKSLSNRLTPDVTSTERACLFAFVTEGCPACGGLIEHLRRRERGGVGQPNVVLVVGQSSPEFTAHLTETHAADVVVQDVDGSIFNDCNIGATPFLVLTDSSLGAVEKRVSSDASELLSLS